MGTPLVSGRVWSDYGPASDEFPARIPSSWQIVPKAATGGRDAGTGPGTRGRGDVGADRGRAGRDARPPDAVSRLPAGRPDRPRRRAPAGPLPPRRPRTAGR